MKEIQGAQGATTPIISDVHFEAALTSSCYGEKAKNIFRVSLNILLR
jgi:hypothetical protein